MPLHPSVQTLLDAAAAAGLLPIESLSPIEAREQARQSSRARASAGETPEIGSLEDLSLPAEAGGNAVRVYRPTSARPDGILLYMHGGGWVVGDLDFVDTPLRTICQRANLTVVSLDYRLAPENPFPAALDDACAALHWVVSTREWLAWQAAPVLLGGDSAGANLAAAAAISFRDERSEQLAGQLLVYPVTDGTMSTRSYAERGSGYSLTASAMRWFWDRYAPGASRLDPRASPLHAPDVSGAAPAVVVTAEYDPLRDEGRAYAARLRDSGVPVVELHFDSLMHGFLGLSGILPIARDALDRICDAVASLLQEHCART